MGYYSTTFNWPPSDNNRSNSDGAYITFPPVTQGLQAWFNGHKLPSLDFANPRADLGPYLVHGVNKVELVVPTVMWNYVRSVFDKVQISGSKPLLQSPLPGAVETGLVGEVRVLPYRKYEIKV